MSHSNPPNFIKAMTGDYRIPIKSIFLEAWYRVKGMKKSFWIGFLYFVLSMALACVLLGFVLALYDVTILQRATAGTLYIYGLKLALKFIIVGIIEILRFLLTASLAYLALNHLRHLPIHARMVFFSFRQAWRPLMMIGLLLYLLNSLLLSGTNIFLHSNFVQQQVLTLGLSVGSIYLVEFVIFLLCFLCYFYFSIVVFMSVLLILDKKIDWKQGLYLAFRSVNRHFLKNIALIILTSLVFGFLAVISFGIGLIWLLPMTSLVTAIQYNQIFCEGNL
jgi:hypothetical protein